MAEASTLITSMPECLWHEVHRCLERTGRYVLPVHWKALEAHTVGFRGSPQYLQ